MAGCETSETSTSQPVDRESLAAQEIASPVDTAQVNARSIAQEIQAQGQVFFTKKVRVSLEVDGWLTSNQWVDGSFVQKGESILTLDTLKAHFQLAQAKENLAKAELERKRLQILYGLSASDDSLNQEIPDSLRRRMQTVDVQSGYRLAEQEVAYWKELMARHSIVAPFSGQILDMSYQKGEYIPRGSVVLRLIDPQAARVHLLLTENEVAQVAIGQEVGLDIPALNRQCTGQLVSIRPMLDEQGLAKVEVDIHDRVDGLMEGMFATARIIVDRQSAAFVVPAVAVLQRKGNPFVFVWKAPGRASWRTVRIGLQTSKWIALDEGVEPGEAVLVWGHEHLSHDAKVKIVETGK